MTRRNEVASDGSVLPMAWNMLDATKMIPVATKPHEMMRRYSSPTATTCASCEKMRTIAAGAMWHSTAKAAIRTAESAAPHQERLSHALRPPRAEVLSRHRCDREAERDDGQVAREDEAESDAEARPAPPRRMGA